MLGRLLDRRKLLLSFVTTQHWRQNFALNLTEGPTIVTHDYFCLRRSITFVFGTFKLILFWFVRTQHLCHFCFDCFAAFWFFCSAAKTTVLGFCTSRFTPCFEFWSRKILKYLWLFFDTALTKQRRTKVISYFIFRTQLLSQRKVSLTRLRT